MSKLSFRARALDASKPMPIYLAEEVPDLRDYSAINRAVPQMPSGMEKEEECEHHLQRAMSTGVIIPTPEVYEVNDIEFYERCYPPDYKMPKQHIHMQPLWQEQEAPEYDIDSEDERWLKQQRHPELTELKFEQMMDKLERCSGQTVVTLNEAKLLLERHDDLVIAVYDYWLNKRLKTQHPLILSVKTESRPGQSTNNPYLAFRRRTEKMQTRKNRKNDESSYEKMLKLRRDLGRALSLLELVARRERSKRELVQLTALLAERRYSAGDLAPPDPVLRPAYTPISVTSSSNYRREAYTAPHFPPRAPSTPVDQPRQREKRPYKRRKHRHHAAPHGPRDIGVYTSSEEEGSVAAEEIDDSPYAFRRKPGCYYQMPTSTLCGDPVDPDDTDKERLYQHELDPRHRFTLTSLRCSWGTLGSEGGCIGFARRRLGRGGRVLLDRIRTPLDDLWGRLPAVPGESDCRRRKQEQIELETKAHRTPMEISEDYHTGGKYPWRHAFRQHLSKHPDLWTVPVKEEDIKPTLDDVKLSPDFLKTSPDVPDFCKSTPDFGKSPPDFNLKDDDFSCVKSEKMDVDSGDDKVLPHDNISDNSVSERRTMDGVVMENLGRTIGGRSWSVCSDTSYDSDESLHPVEHEFEKFINEVNKKWLHFRPKTPPPSPPQIPESDSVVLPKDTEFNVTLISDEPSTALDPFTTENFTLQSLYTDLNEDITPQDDDLINDIGLTDAQVESILSETDLKALADVDLVKDDKKVDLLEELVKEVDNKDPFLSQGQSSDGRANSGPKRKKADAFGSSVVQVLGEELPVTISRDILHPPPPAPPPALVTTAPVATAPAATAPRPTQMKEAPKEVILAHVTDKILQKPVEPPSIKIERKKQHDDVIEEIQLTHGLQVKTVQTKQSPLKKHIITTAVCSTGNDSGDQPQILTVAVSDSLKVRLGSQVMSGTTVGGRVLGVLQNGPFTHALHLPIHNHNSDGQGGSVGLSTGRARVSAPLVQLAHKLHNKLKVHPLPQGHTRGVSQSPSVGVVSLGTTSASTAEAGTTQSSAPLTQLFEIKGRPHQLINVPRHLHPNNKHKVLATFENAGVKGNVSSVASAQRVSVSLDGRLVRACLPARLPARMPARPRQIHLNNRTLQVARPQLARTGAETTSSITLPSAVVANLLHNNAQNKGQKIAISGAAGQALSANVQAIAFTTAQLKARQARLIAQPRPAPVAEIVEASSTPNSATTPSGAEDNLPMEVT